MSEDEHETLLLTVLEPEEEEIFARDSFVALISRHTSPRVTVTLPSASSLVSPDEPVRRWRDRVLPEGVDEVFCGGR